MKDINFTINIIELSYYRTIDTLNQSFKMLPWHVYLEAEPVIKFLASAKYFTLNDVTYEQVAPKEKKEKKGKKEKKKAEGTEPSGPVTEG